MPGQPHYYIDWATSMPFTSINPTNPRTNPYWELAILKNDLFWVGNFEFLCFILMKISHKLCVRMDGTQFLWLWWYTAKTQSPQTFQPAVYSSTWKFSINVRCTKFKTSCFLCKCFLGCPKIPGRCLPKITNLDRLGKRHEWVIIVLIVCFLFLTSLTFRCVVKIHFKRRNSMPTLVNFRLSKLGGDISIWWA